MFSSVRLFCIGLLFVLGVSQLGFAQQMGSKVHGSSSLEVHPGYVYHASPIQHLHVLRPHESTHEKNWVYASPDPVIAASFLIDLAAITDLSQISPRPEHAMESSRSATSRQSRSSKLQHLFLPSPLHYGWLGSSHWHIVTQRPIGPFLKDLEHRCRKHCNERGSGDSVARALGSCLLSR